MIPRYQRVLFWTLLAAIVLMAVFMLHGCAQAREKFTRHIDETPLAAPIAAPNETVRLALADDSTGALTLQDREIALPEEPTARVRVLLTRLLAEYAYKSSHHPLESGPAVDDVFLLNLPIQPAVAAEAAQGRRPATAQVAKPSGVAALQPASPGGQLAIINLHAAFADHHPSGIEPETLTIQSILNTLAANIPRIEQVRFLVDGEPRDTLNGHADLTRTYPVPSEPVASASAHQEATP